MRGRAFPRAAVSVSLAALMLTGLTGCDTRQKYQATYFDMFDSVIRVTAYCDSEAEWESQSQALHDDLMRYHQLFDNYQSYDGVTNLYTLNAGAGGDAVAVDDDLFALLQEGKEMYVLTDGRCNIAAGAVLSLWHDAREAEVPSLPDDAALQEAARHCSMDDLILDETAKTVRLADPEMSIDAGSLAKGWAIEAAAKAAEARGLTSALIDAGSNIRAIGTHADGSPWVAGVTAPWDEDSASLIEVPLASEQSLVTSADTQRYFEVDGVRYSHLIDLETLYPARYFRSVSVLCSDGGLGDALSTGLYCMPLEEGQPLVDSLDGVEAIWYSADGQTVVRTDGFPS
ncbi:FAD:protein FMN transferase [Subdoligranulum sp. DSM 109015]|uniref:FAD:protein FMN transferase n=1 Tax=Gemmiger gallinarum TaxID=2779354 RepID=A0ABR9R1Y6_9FIRM|nr:FAD:protein FMN transferase [Gemmiger gallinarum]